MNNLKIFESHVLDGPFASNKSYYPSYFTKDDIYVDIKKRLDKLGNEKGFDGSNVIISEQKRSDNNYNYEDGDFFVVDEDYVNSKNNLFFDTLVTDILVLKDNIKRVVIGQTLGDCCELFAYDKNHTIVASAHCGAEMINRGIPSLTIDALQKNKRVSDEDIRIYLSSCISGNSYIYDRMPKWATNKDVWEGFIKEKDGLYYINIKSAIIKQLIDRNINKKHIFNNYQDSYKNSALYSNKATYDGIPFKNGRYLAGAFFKDNSLVRKRVED